MEHILCTDSASLHILPAGSDKEIAPEAKSTIEKSKRELIMKKKKNPARTTIEERNRLKNDHIELLPEKPITPVESLDKKTPIS